MKNIKELNLELIQLEDQVLLVDPSKPCQEGDWIYWNKRPVKSIDTTYSKATKYIITSTKQLEGLPLLVIEDEVEKLAINSFGHKPCKEDNDILLSLGKGYVGGFKEGYNKAKSTYKFTEEDLKTAIDASKHGFTDDYIINYLTKKELWVETDCEYGDNCPSMGAYEKQHLCKIIPKITNNQIKAIWK